MEKKTILDLQRVDIDGFRAKPKMALTLVLDNIRSLNNIGSIFRTADAFLVERIHLCGITATPPSAEIHKTALGAENSVEWTYFPSTEQSVALLKSEGYEVCCLEQVKHSVALQEFIPNPSKRYALVLGHEVNGVDQKIVDACDHCIEIPQEGTKHSLNVSVAGGVAMWHFFSRLRTYLG